MLLHLKEEPAFRSVELEYYGVFTVIWILYRTNININLWKLYTFSAHIDQEILQFHKNSIKIMQLCLEQDKAVKNIKENYKDLNFYQNRDCSVMARLFVVRFCQQISSALLGRGSLEILMAITNSYANVHPSSNLSQEWHQNHNFIHLHLQLRNLGSKDKFTHQTRKEIYEENRDCSVVARLLMVRFCQQISSTLLRRGSFGILIAITNSSLNIQLKQQSHINFSKKKKTKNFKLRDRSGKK